MKKLFTLLTLLVAIVTGAWGENISCSATVPAGQEGTFSNTEGIAATNCTLKYSGLQGGTNSVTVNSVDYYKFGSNDAYVQLILSSGSYTKFQAGDVLTATVTSNGGTSAKTVDIKVGASATSTVSVNSSETKNITYTLTGADIEEDGSIKIYRNTNGSNLRGAVFSVTGTRATEKYTVTFNAGSNGTCGTTSLTEESVGAGVTLPAVTPNDGYVFNGWYTAASEGTKEGNAGATYKPTANVTIYAQYSALSAPTINITDANVQTPKGTSVTFTAETTGAPIPTVTWYKNETSSTTGGTSVGTGNTYNPDVTTEGTYYYYAVASNSKGSVSSEVVTLTVTNPDKLVEGNNYYVAVGDLAIASQNVICDDITMQYSAGDYSAATKDETTKGIVANFVATVSCSTSGWGVTFTPSKPGSLKVGVVINKDKTFTITNVSGFNYEGKNPDASGTITSNTWTPSNKIYGVITIKVVPGTSYKFSVAGSKMGFYGFEFTPVESVNGTITDSGYNTYSTNYPVDLSTITGGTAYVATSVTGGKVVLTKCTAKVPAATGLFIAGTAGETFTISTTADETSAPATNLLVAMPNGGTVSKADEGKFNYVFGWTEVSNPGFYLINNTAATLGAFKAYLQTTDALSATSQARMGFLFVDELTGVNQIKKSTEILDGAIYNLSGQRVAQPTKGLYIVNGKKYINQ